jgi:hypothetical protein
VVSVTGAPAITITVGGGENGTSASTAVTEFIPNGATRGGTGSFLNNQTFMASPALTCTILPVTLIDFKINHPFDNSIRAEWVTVSEVSLKEFIVERSLNKIDWVSIQQKAANNKIEKNYYSVPLGLLNESAFYRLKMISNDGKITYSQATFVKLKKAFFTAYTSGNTLIVKNLAESSKTIQIVSSGGQLLLQKNDIFSKEQLIDVSHLLKGVYYVIASSNTETQWATFVVN